MQSGALLSTITLRPEKLGKLGTKTYQLMCELGFNENHMLTLAPPPRHVRGAEWIIERWRETVSAYEARYHIPLQWALIATNDWSATSLRQKASGHVVWIGDKLPEHYCFLLTKWRKFGNCKHTSHDLRRDVHRSKVGYWCQHLENDYYAVDWSDGIKISL